MRQSIKLVLHDEDEAMEGETDSEPDKQVSEAVIPKRTKHVVSSTEGDRSK